MTEKYYGMGLPIDISTHGYQIDRLINVLHIFMIVLFVGWFSFFIYTLFRFRERPGHTADHHSAHFKLPTYLEVGVVLFETALLFIFAIPLFYQLRKEIPTDPNTLRIHVVAEQFAWNIHYPGADKVFGKTDVKLISTANPLGLDGADPAGKDDVITLNQLRIPVNTPIIIDLSSKDVIHSFSLPVMRVKQDTMPGQKIPVWFEAKETGNFEIACAQLCGLGHYRMRGFFVVDSKEAFETWFGQELAKRNPEPKPV